MKTIEEAAEDFAQSDLIDNQAEAFNGFIEGAKFTQRWIPVEEELPELSTFKVFNVVIVRFITDEGNISIRTAVFIQVPPFCFEKLSYPKKWHAYPFSGDELKNVISWRPIEYK